jgi:hypothetical protein
MPPYLREWVSSGGAHYREIPIVCPSFSSEVNQTATDKVKAALTCIEKAWPEQLYRIRNFEIVIVVFWLFNASGQWNCERNAISLDRDFVLDEDTLAEELASTIVHEVTHARLGQVGISSKTHSRARCERICHLAERNFAARLPESEARDKVEESIDWYLSREKVYWSDDEHLADNQRWWVRQPLSRKALFTVLWFVAGFHQAARFSVNSTDLSTV